MTDILNAIIYCHNHNIVHRDIKAENILFSEKDISSECKLIDFGISLKFSRDAKLQDKTGTILYVAPEVLKGSYDEKCDIWACGVLLYLILCGYPPFYGSTRQSVMKKILKHDINFTGTIWSKLSAEVKDIIQLMLTKDPESRPSASQVLEHPWFKNNKQIRHNEHILSKKYLESIARYQASCKLSQAIMTYIVSNISYKNVTSDILNLFKEIDLNGDGKITYEELFFAYKKMFAFKDNGTIEKEIQAILVEVDSNNSGAIDYTEFLVACIDKEKMLSQKMVILAFKQFDLNDDGFISRTEFQAVMGGVILDEMSWNEFLEEIDTDKDGQVSF